MIIWSGWGIVMGGIGLLCLIVAQLGANTLMHDNQYYEMHDLPKLLGMLLAAAISYPVGRAMNEGQQRWLVDPRTGEEVRVGGGHSLFFIPVQYWWIVYAVLGVFIVIF